MLQGGPAVDTIIYDRVLEAAMRAQNFNSRMLHISGPWIWLLDEFSDYYGISDAYRKLRWTIVLLVHSQWWLVNIIVHDSIASSIRFYRYLSYIMNVAIPTKDCLELIYELLVPVTKAREDRTLTRQEVSSKLRVYTVC